MRCHTIGKAACGIHEFAPACGKEPGDGRLGQVAQAVELMIVSQVGERALTVSENIEGIQVSVLFLRRAYKIRSLLGSRLKRFVRMLHQLIGNRLQPLVQVGILEDKTVKSVRLRRLSARRNRLKRKGQITLQAIGFPEASSLLQSCRRPEVMHAEAGSRVRHPVIECFPLVGNHGGAHQLHFALPEFVFHTNLPQGKRGTCHRSASNPALRLHLASHEPLQ